MGQFKGELPVFARLWPVRVRVSFTTGAVRLAILATAGLLVFLSLRIYLHPAAIRTSQFISATWNRSYNQICVP